MTLRNRMAYAKFWMVEKEQVECSTMANIWKRVQSLHELRLAGHLCPY